MEAFLKTPYTQEDLQKNLINVFNAQTNLSQASKTQYALKLSQWLIYLTPTSQQSRTLYTLLYNPKQSYQCLQTTPAIKHSPQNHHIYISASVAFIKHILKDELLFKSWKEIERTNSEPIADHYENNAPTEKQKDKTISFQELQKIRLSLPKGSTERLLLSFYTLIEPIRADYFATEIVGATQTPTEENYIVLAPSVSAPTAAQLMVQDFKTKQRYRAIENQIPQELLTELIESLKQNPRKYLFTTPENPSMPFNRKLFSNWACRTLTRVLKQPMTLTALRHIYISNKIQSKTPTQELKEIAKKMGHSRDMQRIYEWSE
jgi:hypothetical protein